MISVIICSGLAISRLTLLIPYLFLGLSPWSCLPPPAADPCWSFVAAKVPMEVKSFLLLDNPLEFQLQLSFTHVPPACLYPSWVPHNAIQKPPSFNCAPPYCRYQGVRQHWRSFVYRSLAARIKPYSFFAFSQDYLNFLSILLVAFDIKNSHRTLQTHQY